MGISDLDITILGVFGASVVTVFLLILLLRDTKGSAASIAQQRWFSPVPAKRWGEKFFLYYSCFWISWFGYIVVSGVWENFGPWEYVYVGAGIALPCFLLPWLFLKGDSSEQNLPFYKRYWARANVWIAIFSFIGNHFWTHYFYTVLDATYSFKAHRLNNVPLAMHLCTHAYFCSYHAFTSVCIRRWKTSKTYAGLPCWLKSTGSFTLIVLLAYFTAWTEALTISGFPYYVIGDRKWFYTVGSLFYSIYFIVSFPMFARVDEDGPGQIFGPIVKAEGKSEKSKTDVAKENSAAKPWCVRRTAVESLAAGMAVTILLDLARIAYDVAKNGAENVEKGTIPWFPA